MLEQIFGAVEGAAKGLAKTAGDVLTNVATTTGGVAVGIANTFGDTVTPIVGTAGEVAKNMIQTAGGAIDGMTRDVGKNLGHLIDGTGGAVAGSLNALSQTSGAVLDSVGRAFWPAMPAPPAKTVFVVHGRNRRAWQATSEYLKALELSPQNFETLIESGNLKPPFTVQDVLKRAFSLASAVVVLFTPDELAELASEFGGGARRQSRANVFVEAGMALGLHLERTILVTFSGVELPTDISGYVAVSFDDDVERMKLARRAFRGQLKASGVSLGGGDEYLSAGKFDDVVRPHSRRGQDGGAHASETRAGEAE